MPKVSKKSRHRKEGKSKGKKRDKGKRGNRRIIDGGVIPKKDKIVLKKNGGCHSSTYTEIKVKEDLLIINEIKEKKEEKGKEKGEKMKGRKKKKKKKEIKKIKKGKYVVINNSYDK